MFAEQCVKYDCRLGSRGHSNKTGGICWLPIRVVTQQNVRGGIHSGGLGHHHLPDRHRRAAVEEVHDGPLGEADEEGRHGPRPGGNSRRGRRRDRRGGPGTAQGLPEANQGGNSVLFDMVGPASLNLYNRFTPILHL